MKARQILKRQTTSASTCMLVLRALLLMTSKADKLPLETRLVAHDNNMILALKTGYQTWSRLTQLIIPVYINNTLHLAQKYALIFMRGHYLFRVQVANSFLKG